MVEDMFKEYVINISHKTRCFQPFTTSPLRQTIRPKEKITQSTQ